MWYGVLEGFQKMKMYDEANTLLKFLLEQQVYLLNDRGSWWERIVINTQFHLVKGADEVKLVLVDALKDEHLRENHRLALSQKLVKVMQTIHNRNLSFENQQMPSECDLEKVKLDNLQNSEVGSSQTQKLSEVGLEKDHGVEMQIHEQVERFEKVGPQPPNTGMELHGPSGPPVEKIPVMENTKSTINEVWNNDEAMSVSNVAAELQKSLGSETGILIVKHQIKERTILGEKLYKGPGARGKSVFTLLDATGFIKEVSVEELAIDHYVNQLGFTYGIHGECSSIIVIYGLLFWDIIYHDEFHDSFYHSCQPFPLDLHYEEFYQRRKHLIDEKLMLIRTELEMNDLIKIVDDIWTSNENKLSIVNWAVFENDLGKLKSLMKAMGNKMIANICERLAKSFRQYCTGFPDLVVWKDAEQMDVTCQQQNLDNVLFVEVKGPGDKLHIRKARIVVGLHG